MARKIFKTGNSLVVTLPKEALELLNLDEGSEISIEVDKENKQLIISPAERQLDKLGVDETFSRQVSEFIEHYRPALEALAES